MEQFFGIALAGGAVLLVDQRLWVVAVRVAAEGLALLFCLRGKPYVAPFAVLAAALLALSGHAHEVGAQFADVLHVLSAAMWAGGILALARLRPPDGWNSAEARVLLERFGRVALIAFGITALTGVLRATESLSGVTDLWTTNYGVVLLLKAFGVLLMLILSALWRRGSPVARWDSGAAAFVVALTALLATFPPPA
jgi:putative copper export protein